VAITNGYISERTFRDAIGDTSTVQQATIERSIETASRQVDAHCGRRFYKDTAATDRYYNRDTAAVVRIDDFWTTTGLVVAADPGDDGTWEESWTITTDFVAGPINGIMDGLPWPYVELAAVGNKTWPPDGLRGTIKVTAKWGWASVPDAIQMATLLIAKDLFKRPESLTGGYVGLDGWGPARIREDPAVMQMLRPYVASTRFFVA
jgi:hypothetical protein